MRKFTLRRELFLAYQDKGNPEPAMMVSENKNNLTPFFMKYKLLCFVVLLSVNNLALAFYDFSYTYQGNTLYYTINSTNVGDYVCVVNPTDNSFYSYVSGAVIIPDSVVYGGIKYAVTSIDYCAFRGCIDMTTISIPNEVTIIGQYAFYGCSGLISVAIPNGVNNIGQRTFYDCSSLSSVTFGSGLTSISSLAFFNCVSLTSITIPEGVASIRNDTFAGCTGITSIVVASGNTYYDSRNNCNAIIRTDDNLLVYGCSTTTIPGTINAIGDRAFEGCSALTSIILPQILTSIGDNAFCGCDGLSSVTIPSSLSNIGSSAFMNCSNLTSVYCQGTTPPSLGFYAFGDYDRTPINHFFVPCDAVESYWNNNDWSDYASRVYGNPELEYVYGFYPNNEESGIVEVGIIDCDSNITITAVANNGYRFDHWSNGVMDNPYTLFINRDTNIVAYFEQTGDTEGIGYLGENDSALIWSTNGQIFVTLDMQVHLLRDIQVYDMMGRLIATLPIVKKSTYQFIVPASGVYMVKIGDRPARRIVVIR